MADRNEWKDLLDAAMAMSDAIDAQHRRILPKPFLSDRGWHASEMGKWRSPYDPNLLMTFAEALSSERKRTAARVCDIAKRLVTAAAMPPVSSVSETVARKHLAEELRRTARLLWPENDDE